MDDELFKRRQEGLLLRCVDKQKVKWIMHGVHEGTCKAHKLDPKMR